MLEKYPCNSCGICCTQLNKNELYKPMHNGDGICFHFCRDTNKCEIYDLRPTICILMFFLKDISRICHI